MKNNKIMWRAGQFLLLLASVAMLVSMFGSPAKSAEIKVAVVRSWAVGSPPLPVFKELNDNWSAYGTIPLNIDLSLKSVSSFTYQDLVNTKADVLWLSDPAGGNQQYSPAEINAIGQYVSEGHSILGTYKTFQHSPDTKNDNRALAPIFGLRSDINYNAGEVAALKSFNILDHTELFRNLPNPYVTSGYPFTQLPADDLSWDANDLGGAQIVAQTNDNRGVITWYETQSYHAIYVSEMPEYNGSSADTQFLYNALTVPEPSTLVLLGIGAISIVAYSWRQRMRIG